MAAGGAESLVAAGRLDAFRCAFGEVAGQGDGLALSPACAAALGVTPADRVGAGRALA